jgi:hypothetical protein
MIELILSGLKYPAKNLPKLLELLQPHRYFFNWIAAFSSALVATVNFFKKIHSELIGGFRFFCCPLDTPVIKTCTCNSDAAEQ